MQKCAKTVQKRVHPFITICSTPNYGGEHMVFGATSLFRCLITKVRKTGVFIVREFTGSQNIFAKRREIDKKYTV